MRTVAVILLSLMLFGCNAEKAKAKKQGNEASAVGSIRAIAACQAIFLETGGTNKYGTLKELGAKDLLDGELAGGKKHGYKFKMVVGDKDGSNKEFQYSVTAEPIEKGKSGDRYFFGDHTGVIRYDTEKVATAQSKAIGS
ncbi:MAG: hypothetical protein P1V97_00910 [Planctomycetota bacterium]|nr:hypothetical protein [Planctomycetota bacterium]